MVFHHTSLVHAPAAEVFRWHERPDAILTLLPLRRLIRIEEQVGGLEDGGRVTIAVGVGPIRTRWTARHFGYIRGEQFCDELLEGPFAFWRHTHRFEEIALNETMYEDHVECALPGGALVNRLCAPLMRKLLTRTFHWRHDIVRQSLLKSAI